MQQRMSAMYTCHVHISLDVNHPFVVLQPVTNTIQLTWQPGCSWCAKLCNVRLRTFGVKACSPLNKFAITLAGATWLFLEEANCFYYFILKYTKEIPAFFRPNAVQLGTWKLDAKANRVSGFGSSSEDRTKGKGKET